MPYCQFLYGPFSVAKGHTTFYKSPFDPQLHQSWGHGAHIRWPKATGPPEELEGGLHNAPNFNLTSQGAQRAPIWWPKATSPPQELEDWPPKGEEPSS